MSDHLKKQNYEWDGNDCLMCQNDEVWSLLNLNDDLVGSGEKFVHDKLPELRSDTCQPPISVKEMIEPITTERERRKKMGIMFSDLRRKKMGIMFSNLRRKKMGIVFSNLHAFLPQLSPKANKSIIIDEAVSYIKTLQKTLQKLEEQKQEKLQAGMKLPSIGREPFLADQGSASNSAAIKPTNYNKGASTFLLMK
ncbi:hypothetical protein HAX54_028516 [Datura stramonium]|uniref:BHLH domain-containing protein n=1 Tax=Datura stramonium TaxID=4076 RepID=A0ABS8V4L4_DATST|nr:hypothetical protein [Datura stramonium]